MASKIRCARIPSADERQLEEMLMAALQDDRHLLVTMLVRVMTYIELMDMSHRLETSLRYDGQKCV